MKKEGKGGKMKKISFIVMTCALLILMACGDNTTAPTTTEAMSSEIEESTIAQTTEPMTSAKEYIQLCKEKVDVTNAKPNEAGKVMVLMYHYLADENSAYGLTPESFKADLQRLYDMGFRTVSMQDFINNTYDVPKGTTPIVMTFDDGHPTQFRFLVDENGETTIDPTCHVGMMNEFYESHPDFGRHAIFYLNGGVPFGQEAYVQKKLDYLREHGYEIGNHSYRHENLSQLNAEQIQETLGRTNQYYMSLNQGIPLTSLALPFGIEPKEALQPFKVKGVFEGVSYHHDVVLLVGANPTFPLYRVESDATQVARVGSGDAFMQLAWWLDKYEEDDMGRYISDGVPEVITIPKGLIDNMNLWSIEEERLLTY